MDEREEQNRDLWQGGPWERSGPQPGSPGAMPPRYVPPRPVLRPRRRKRRFSLPICMGLAALLISLVAISAVMESLWPVQLLPSDDGDYSYHQDYDQEELDTTPPSIPRAATGAGVTVELRLDTGETLTYTQIYDKNLPSMVSIQAEDAKSYSTGTGVVLTSDGYIITNAHVVAGADKVQVVCSDNRVLDAALVGFDANEDLAVLKVEATDLTPAEFGDSFALRCGDPVAAIGDPLGYRSTITDGIVSALDRLITTSSTDANSQTVSTTLNVLQTNCAINPGNSGGPLFNSYGEVIGITTAKYSTSSSGTNVEGLGFAIPINDVLAMIEDIMTNGYVTDKAYMGIVPNTLTAQMAMQYRYDISEGVFISYVEENSPASEAGLQMGDVITAIDGKSIASYEELVAAKKGYSAGDTSTLTIYRAGKTMEVQLTWGAQPEDTTASNDTNTNTDANDNSGDQYSQDDLNDLFRYFFGNRGYGYGG